MAIGFLFIFRPTPSRRLFLSCGPQIIPRPRAEGGAGGDDDGVAGVMMIAGGHAFPVRSLAIARSLFRIHCVGRGCAPFFSVHSFGIPSGEGGRVCRRGGLAARPSTRLAARVLVSPLCSSFIVHPCRSKQEASAFPVSTACLVPHPVKSSARCLIRFAHPSRSSSRSSSRRASRRPSRSHAVSLHRLVLISSRPVVPDVPHACRPSCRRAVLFSSSRRSPHALPPLPLSSPHDRITQGGQRIPPHAPGADKHGANEQHAHRNDTDSTPPPQERLITYPQGDKTNEKKTRRASKTPRTRRYDETEGRRRPRETQMRRTKRTSKTRRLNETEGRDAPRDEQEQQESNETTG